MKYIKLYEGRDPIVTNRVDETIPNDIRMDLKDILLELSDEGFNISFHSLINSPVTEIKIQIINRRIYGDVSESFL